MNGYTKLFQDIVTSSIWGENDKTRIVWITMLALADRDGVVRSSLGGLAHQARVGKEDCEAALKKLMAPDDDSRSKEFGGRRIEPTDGGWLLLNHAKYRSKMGMEERREYLRMKKQEYRAKEKAARAGMIVRQVIRERVEAEEKMRL
jgi:hypothetical protein